MGRPRIEVTEELCEEAERLAGLGLTKKQIATSLGFCYATLREKEKEYSKFSDAIKSGQIKGIEEVTNALFENAMSGNITAQIFFLKNRAASEWKDRVAEITQDAPPPTRIEIVTVDGRKKD